MDRKAAEQMISDLYEHALKRKPGAAEFTNWVAQAMAVKAPEFIVRSFYTSKEYLDRNEVTSTFAAGHYHSPVVDPRTVKDYVTRERTTRPEQIAGIEFDMERMRRLWLDNLTFIQQTPFVDEKSAANRYHYMGGPFTSGDAAVLRMMVRHHRPKRVIEIGSGFSSACMLDAAEHAGLADFRLICIEPDTARLKSLLRPGDAARVTIIEKLVQNVPATIVDTLEPGDFLFIDSTHVMKTGSDVHYEFFHLLPRLRPGVIIHVHDIPFPFEYSDKWLYERNYSWNEAYMLRAFLMYNTQFKIMFWNTLYATVYMQQIRAEYPTFLKNAGGSIWLERA